MADEMDVDALTEELTIQQVIFDSLKGESFAGVEEEREEAQKEIGRLKGLLKAARRKQPSTSEEPHPSRQDGRGQATAAGPSASMHTAPFVNPAAMSTPPGGNDIWSDPGSATLPSRKRDFDATNLQNPYECNKSRRTTPVPNGRRELFLPSSAHSRSDVEVIDLTGDNDDDDVIAVSLAAQIKAEKRREQEMQDREIAQFLSNQDSQPSQLSVSGTQRNAFDRLMGSQLPAPSAQEVGELGPEVDLDPFAPPLPGRYDPAWDDQDNPFNARPAPHTPGATAPSRGFVSAPGTPWGPAGAQYGSPINHAPHSGYQGATPRAGIRPVHFSLQHPHGSGSAHGHQMPSFSRGSVGPWGPGYQMAPGMPAQNPSNLSDIINRTNNIDYANGLDMFGNPLPERVTDYIQDAYHDPRMSEKDLDNLLQNIRPDMDIPDRNRDGTPDGLKRPLYPHQELALTWMKKMEEGTNKGGILADDMGLGKTISTLALLLSRPPNSRPKTNLIIGPVALIRQWEEEIQSKTKLSHRMSVFVYHNKKTTTEELLKYDVVLTTYGTVAAELKRLEKYYEDHVDRNIDFNDKTLSSKCPLLHPKKATFYRIILDEAQCIKNKDTRTAKACHQLKATYRWCLTGTPMMNGVLELYSLLRFLNIKPFGAWDEFRQRFGVLFGRNGDPKGKAMNSLRVLLKAIMLRRKKNSQIDGKPILKLPEKTEEVVYAQLSPDEKDFYEQLERKSQVQFSKYLRDGSIGKNYSSILVLLLRLRQACCHPHLNLDVDDVTVTSMASEDKEAIVKALDQAIVDRIKAIEAFECPICYDAVPCPSFFVPCGHDSCSECLCRLTENATSANLQEGTESNKAKCPVCRGLFDPSKCFTYDTFKKVHLAECVKKSESDEEEEEEEEKSSEEDSDDDDEDSDAEFASDEEVDGYGNLRDFIVDDDDTCSDQEDKKQVLKPGKKKKSKGKKKASDIKPSMLKTLRKEGYKNREAFKKYMRYLRKTWMPAAKVTECIRLITEIQKTGEKTIIFSQWTLLLDLLEVAMWHEKLKKPERYDGSMSATERNTAAHNFRDKKDVKVMLVSLRAGNAGLNLTAASRVIIMDPFWNPYIEMQAVDRAYRIGQQQEVKVYRILTKDTVEDRIVALQEKKKAIVEAALDEAESAKIGRLNVNELKFLFNTARE